MNKVTDIRIAGGDGRIETYRCEGDLDTASMILRPYVASLPEKILRREERTLRDIKSRLGSAPVRHSLAPPPYLESASRSIVAAHTGLRLVNL